MDVALRHEIAALHEASFAWALTVCGYRDELARDVLQTSYVKILDGRARFGRRSAVKTWLFSVIRKTATDALRRERVRRAALSLLSRHKPVPPVAFDIDATDRRSQVRAAMLDLSPRQREVIELVFFHDLTVESSADVMGVSVGTARTHYHRGKRELATKLAEAS